jgi:hypothetical protein
MNSLAQFIGKEHRLDELARAVRMHVDHLRAQSHGALQVTCSDESERECCDAFQQGIVNDLLPSLKFARKSAVRSANLGGRYEWGAVRVAEEHYAVDESRNGFKVILVKINSHVSADERGDGQVFGRMSRYRRESVYCSALDSLLRGRRGPAFLEQLHETFLSECLDRIAILNDPKRVDPQYRNLFIAVTNARLQARKAILDIQDYRPLTPTHFVVGAFVTINRSRHDTELLCGFYDADCRSNSGDFVYQGLGDDPSLYRVDYANGKLQLNDPNSEQSRIARDHREIVSAALKSRAGEFAAVQPQIKTWFQKAGLKASSKLPAKQLLQGLLLVLGEVTPVPVAMFLFASGLAGVYNTFGAHKLLEEDGDRDAADRMIVDVRKSLDSMSSKEAESALIRLMDFAHAMEQNGSSV